MKLVKKSLVVVSLFTMLFAALPKQEAKAGIILAPTGVGLVFIVMGVIYDHLGLVILENEAPSDKIAADFANRYGHLTSNLEAFAGLASMVAERIPAEGISSEMELNFSKKEIIKALGAAAANKELVNAVSADLK